MDPTEVMSWKGLAAFCFGPDKLMKDEEQTGDTDANAEMELENIPQAEVLKWDRDHYQLTVVQIP